MSRAGSTIASLGRSDADLQNPRSDLPALAAQAQVNRQPPGPKPGALIRLRLSYEGRSAGNRTRTCTR